MALIIAGERSGVGKTTVTLALLSALSRRGLSVQSFKVGPDYIDPMFHRQVTGRPCRNLDPVLTSEAYVQHCVARHSAGVSHVIVEGVMGLFDGAAHREDYASTAHIARLLQFPVLLVLDCSRLSHSIAALVHGYRSFDPRLKFAGVVLNRVGSDRHLELLQSALEPLHLPILGVLRRQDGITVPNRHLGLVPIAELKSLNPLLDQLADLGETCFDWSRLLPLLQAHPHRQACQEISTPPASQPKTRIAIAQDAAFNFYYADNLELLEALGAELVFWSPLVDAKLPDTVHGLYFGGGFPEVFAEQLADNQSAKASIQAAIRAGIPTYAECGGLMYLCQQITDFGAKSWPMLGVLPTTAVMGSQLTLGYRTAKSLQNGPMLQKGTIVEGHEFHRSHLTVKPTDPLFELLPHSTQEGWYQSTLHASYLHFHWGARPEIPEGFMRRCQDGRR